MLATGAGERPSQRLLAFKAKAKTAKRLLGTGFGEA